MSDPYQSLGVQPPASSLPQPKPAIASVAELRSYEPSLSEKIKGMIQSALMRMGMAPYQAGHIAGGITSLASNLPPIGVPMAANEMQRASQSGDLLGTILAGAGAIPGVRPEAKAAQAAAQEIKAAGKSKSSSEDLFAELRDALGVTGETRPAATVKAPNPSLGALEEMQTFFAGSRGAPPTKAELAAQAAQDAAEISKRGKPTVSTQPTRSGGPVEFLDDESAGAMRKR